MSDMFQGVGKSKILSMIHDLERKSVQDDIYKPRSSSTVPSPSIFPIESMDTYARGSHETVGIDIAITTERIFFLDTQVSFQTIAFEIESLSYDDFHSL